MREIKFRGFIPPQYEIKGKWVYGLLILHLESHSIIKDNGINYAVTTESVGQFTGLKDKNGVEIYEGDCLGIKENVVTYIQDTFCINGDRPLYPICLKFEVIGNIHDKP